MLIRGMHHRAGSGSTPADGVTSPGRRACAFVILLLFLAASSPVVASGTQETTLPAKLVEGGKIFLKNDLQAWSEAMLVFRGFRRELRRIERYEEVDSEEEADLIGILSGDPNVVESNAIVNRGIPYPSGYTSSKVMLLVIFDAKNNNLLWFDAVDWDTTGNVTRVDSHEKLVRRLKAALDDAG